MKLSLVTFSTLVSVALATVNTIKPPTNGNTTLVPGTTTLAPLTGRPANASATTSAPGTMTNQTHGNATTNQTHGLEPCNIGAIKGKLFPNETALLIKCESATGFDISTVSTFLTKNTSTSISKNRDCADSYNAMFTRGQSLVECGVNVGGKTENLRTMMSLFLSGKTGNITADANSSSKSSSGSSDLESGSSSRGTVPQVTEKNTSKKDSSKTNSATMLTTTFAAAAVAVVVQLVL